MSKSKKKTGKSKSAGELQNKNTKAQKIKKNLPVIIASVVAVAGVAAVVVFNASGNVNSPQTTTGSTADEASAAESSGSSEASNSAESTAEYVSGKYDLKSLQTPGSDTDDKAAGIWKITSGTGSQYENFYYLFDGDGMSALIAGTSGYMSKYEYETDDSGAELLTVNLVFGLSGSYTYEFSGDTMTLTDSDSGAQSVLTKADNASFMPSGSENAQIDENLVGCWSSGEGEYLCFDTNGVMYQNLFDNMFTYSTYTVADGKVESTYTALTDTATDTYTYSVDGDTLALDDSTYTRISFDEMK